MTAVREVRALAARLHSALRTPQIQLSMDLKDSSQGPTAKDMATCPSNVPGNGNLVEAGPVLTRKVENALVDMTCRIWFNTPRSRRIGFVGSIIDRPDRAES